MRVRQSWKDGEGDEQWTLLLEHSQVVYPSHGKPEPKVSGPCASVGQHTRKFPKILLGLHTRPSVHLLIPLSCSSKTKTAPLWTMPLSRSINLRVTLGIIPLLAASNTRSESNVVSMYPLKGGSRTGGGDAMVDVRQG